MAPSRPAKAIKVNVPRLNATKVGRALASEIEVVAKELHVKVVVRDSIEPSSPMALAIENASEWNSLLMTARAGRGPQWDIGTQQFMVDEGSELYYDSSPLTKKESKPEEPLSQPRFHNNNNQMHTPQHQVHRSHPQHQQMYNQYNNVPMHSPVAPQHNQQLPQHMMNFSGSPYGNHPVPPNQFYGGEMAGSPVHMRMQMGGLQDGRRVTRAMAEDGYSMHGL